MQYLAALFTFLAVAFALAAWVQIRQGRSRLAHRLLAERDPTAQAATAVRLPGPMERLEQAAKQAGLSWTRRFFLLAFASGLLLGLLFIMADSHLGGLAVMLVSSAGPVLVVRQRARVRAELFAAQLPQTLTLMANVIRAGGTLYQAIGAVTRQMPEPIRSEFVHVERAMQLQVPAAEALGRIRDRIGLAEYGSVVVACKVAGEAGADLELVLEAIARELVEDRQFLRAMQSASTEGKSSARMVTAVPFVVMGLVTWQNPGYFGHALQDPLGRMLILSGVAAILVGWLAIQRITDVRNW